MRTRVARILMLAALVLTGAAPASGATHTTATVYRAFFSNGASRLHTRSRTGSCWTGSSTANRRDAWRCLSANFIYDPCFSSPKASGIVLCPDAPPARTGVRMRLTKPLPAGAGNTAAPSTHAQPWAIELFSGRRCVFSSGASSVVQGARLNYFCGSANYGLWGFPDRRAQPWRIYLAPFSAKRLTQRAAVKHAWM